MIQIRPATVADVPAITEIYNDAVRNTVATFDTEEKSVEDRMQWFLAHDEKHPVLVSCQGDVVTGFASLNRWSDRAAYDLTAEVSLYVHPDFRRRGIGKQLLEMLTLRGKEVGLHTLLARITEGNEQSIYLHERMGFKQTGLMLEVGYKFGKFLNVHMLQVVF